VGRSEKIDHTRSAGMVNLFSTPLNQKKDQNQKKKKSQKQSQSQNHQWLLCQQGVRVKPGRAGNSQW
jgi:hypothetical protein